MKLSKVLLTLVLTMFISSGVLASSQDISITIDGVKLHTDVAPKAINNRTMVPMRAIFEAMGAMVDWDNNNQIARGIRGKDIIILQLGNKKARINEKEVILDVPATAVDGRTLVPVRFIAESLGSIVNWDNKTNTVTIESNKQPISITDEKYFKFDKEKGEITKYSDDGPNDVIIPTTIGGITVKSIGNEAFWGSQLDTIVIPSGVVSLGNKAFAGNNLFSVIIPDSVTDMGSSVFAYNSLTSVTLSKGMKNIGDNSFGENYLTSVTIPEGVTKIDGSAFYGNHLTSIIIPEGVKSIGNEAFAINQLTSIRISDSVTSIGNSAFHSNNLTSVEIPSGVKKIGGGSFMQNYLTSVTIPKGVTDLEEYAFDDNVKIIRK